VNFWDKKLYLDDVFFEISNVAYKTLAYLKDRRRDHGLADNLVLKNKYPSGKCFVVGNAPSVNRQDLTLLKNELTFFVNRAFLHPDYEFIKPTYHLFLDGKLQAGTWPLKFLDEIVEKNPDVTFLLNADWYHDAQFQPYKKFNIHWIDTKLILTRFYTKEIDLSNVCVGGGGVVESGILAAAYMGIKDIYFLGVDGDGLIHNLMGNNSHFYGSNPEDMSLDMLAVAKDLYFMSMSIRKWVYIADYCKKRDINLVNLTAGGILDICPRAEYEAQFSRHDL
jgi:hypothetical protein